MSPGTTVCRALSGTRTYRSHCSLPRLLLALIQKSNLLVRITRTLTIHLTLKWTNKVSHFKMLQTTSPRYSIDLDRKTGRHQNLTTHDGHNIRPLLRSGQQLLSHPYEMRGTSGSSVTSSRLLASASPSSKDIISVPYLHRRELCGILRFRHWPCHMLHLRTQYWLWERSILRN